MDTSETHKPLGFNPPASDFYGRKITSAELWENNLELSFDDRTKIAIWDAGQSCCENRYMTTDDDVQYLVGSRLIRIEEKPGPDEYDDENEVHETCFVEVGTDQGFITLVTHNVHNGYYGGFALEIKEGS